MTDQNGLLPSFFIVGPPRTGTSWLHQVLQPHTCLPRVKETRFFDERFTDQVGANVRLQRTTIEDLLNPIRLDGGTETKLDRPAPDIRHQVSSHVAIVVVQDRQET